MSLKSLLLCADEKIVRVLRRVLGDLDIDVELCADADSALRKLTRQRFEAIIVDITDEGASEVLHSVRNAPCNKQAVAVAIVEPLIGLKAVFALGAHFVLYKPVSIEFPGCAGSDEERASPQRTGRGADPRSHAQLRSGRQHPRHNHRPE